MIKTVVFDAEGTLFDGSHAGAAYEGLHNMLANLQGQGLQMAIVTGAGQTIHSLLERQKATHYFTSIVHRDRVEHSKPHPEGFLLAMDECGTTPKEAIMVGDSPNDIFAGKNAGAAFTIGIVHGQHDSQPVLEALPDYTVGSLPELTDVLIHLTRGSLNKGNKL